MLNNEKIFLLLDDLHVALPIADNGDGVRSLLSALNVLSREDLIASHGDAGRGNRANPKAWDILQPHGLVDLAAHRFPGAGLICAPTPNGIELFIRGCGSREHDPTYIRELHSDLVDQVEVGAVVGARVADLPVL